MSKSILEKVKGLKISKKDLIERTLSFVLGSLVSFSLVYAATIVESNLVSYDNSSSGLNSETVQDAIDELYGMTGGCPKGYVCEKISILYDKIQEQAKTDTINFAIRSGTSGTHGVYTTTETEGNVPVYYFRGDADKVNNNVIYNNMCWKIIRTTETGGVKLIYNGTPTSDGKCNKPNSTAGTETAQSSTLSMSSSSKYYYGTSYTFDENTGKYSLAGTLTNGVWSSSYVGYYTCKSISSTGKCTPLYKITGYVGTTKANYSSLDAISNVSMGTSAFNSSYNDNAYVGYMYGSTGASTYAATHANTNNSTIKTYIDNWFSTNFNSDAIEKLEDTVFCNDRSTTTGTNNNDIGSTLGINGTLGYGTTNTTGYGALARSTYNTLIPRPSLVCPQTNDKFTLKSTKQNYNPNLNGNKALDYPVGLITLDELVFAGFNTYKSNTSDDLDTTNYLFTGQNYWTLSPVYYLPYASANVGSLLSSGRVHYGYVKTAIGVRPAVSLRDGTLVETGGDGSMTAPYVVK